MCWNAYRSELDIPPDSDFNEPTGLVRLWVMHTGKQHYLVHGSNTEPHPDYPNPLVNGTPTNINESLQLANGNAIVYPDNIVMHLSSSGPSEVSPDDEVRGWLGTINLDRDTLNGYFEGVGIHYTPNSSLGEVKYDGIQTLEYIPCPK